MFWNTRKSDRDGEIEQLRADLERYKKWVGDLETILYSLCGQLGYRVTRVHATQSHLRVEKILPYKDTNPSNTPFGGEVKK